MGESKMQANMSYSTTSVNASGIIALGARGDDIYTIDGTSIRTREKLFKTKQEMSQSKSVGNEQTQQPTTINFNIEPPYTIASNGKTQKIDIKTYPLPATYQYQAVPKLDADAFLVAQATDWEELNLLAGEASLFFEDTYLGSSLLNTQNLEDTLLLSLGRDKNVVIERKKTNYNKRQLLGGNKTESRTFEIIIKNKKQQAINLVIEDQIPISTDKAIMIENIDHPEAEYDEKTGKLTWRIMLPANADKKISFKYTVKYPKDRTLLLE
jgi:uncharacterized protein (TIGR02231 family)